MKRISFVCLTALMCISLLLITGCSKKDGDKEPSLVDFMNGHVLDPNQTDLYLSVMNYVYYDGNRDDSYHSIIMPIKQSLYGASLTVKVNGNPVEVNSWINTWYFIYDYVQGQNYLFEITANGVDYSVTLKVPYTASSTIFPASYNPAQSAAVSWQLSNDNENQLAFAYSVLWDHDEWNDEGSDWMREISTSARSFNFPANVVTNFGEDTSYELTIMQVNFKKSGKLAAIGISDRTKTYDDDDWQSIEKTVSKVEKIINHFK